MSSEIMQETTPLVECSAFHRGMSVLEASLRNTEDSDAIISGLLKGAAEFYGASRASVVEADWDLGIGVITYEWCKDGVSAQRDMLQCLPMEKFPRWRKALRANKPVVISDLQRLEKVYPDEAAFFREYGVTTLLAAPFSKRINQGFIAVDDPTRYTDDPVFLFIASYAVVVELNEIKQQQSLLAATKASKYNPEDIHVNFFGGMEIISSKGTLTGEDIKADQCYLLLAYLILNHKKNSTVDTLAEIICPYDELDSPYKVVNNIVYRLRRTLSVIGLDKLVIGKNGTFQINPNFNIHTDFDRFEDACIQLKTEENPDMRHSLYHSAVDMYKGQLLPRCEHELWLMQLSMYYQSLYLQITKGYVRLKMECKDYILAQKTAIDALRFDPKDSELNMYAILAIHRGQEFGRISFDYSDRDTVLGKLSLTAGSYLLNAGMVLFGETPYNDLQMAVFAGTERLTFLDIQREHGTIFELVDRAEKYIFKNIRWRVEFGSLQRKEIPEIPVDAVREALINSFCHKEYGTGQNNEVSIYKDRVEIYNPGTFPAGYEPEDFISGRERPIRRNPLIAQTLYYSKNVESFGTGLKRIADACDAAGCKYKFEVLKSGFVVVFYRSDENFDTTGTDTTPVTIPVNTPDKDIRSKIVSLCLNAPQTREQLMQACGMKNKAHFLKAYLKPMLETGELQLTVPDKPNSRNQKYIAVRHTTGEVR